jgi:hypothetical protein
METIIKVSASELNSGLLDRIKQFIGNKENVDVTISLHEFDTVYSDELNLSIDQSDRGEIISMTMEEFASYTPLKKQ